MTRQLEQKNEDRLARRRLLLEKATIGGLESAVERAGGELLGISVKFHSYEVLVTLRAMFPAGKMVGFVGAADLCSALIKAANMAGRDEIRWRADRWVP
jgi:hypothetical protein